jgi:hypothetical protein
MDVRSEAPSTPVTATIANGAALSGAVDLGSSRLHRIVMPAGWTSAALTFQGSYDGTNFNDLYDGAAGEYSISSSIAGASRSIVVDPKIFYGVRHLKVRSGTSGTPANQGAERALTLVTVPR